MGEARWVSFGVPPISVSLLCRGEGKMIALVDFRALGCDLDANSRRAIVWQLRWRWVHGLAVDHVAGGPDRVAR